MARDAAPPALLKTISCKCHTSCTAACGCRRAGLNCYSLCKHCIGQSCENTQEIVIDKNDDDEDFAVLAENKDYSAFSAGTSSTVINICIYIVSSEYGFYWKLFYGTKEYIHDIPSDNGSDDPELSDDEDNVLGRVLILESDEETEQEVESDDNDDIIVPYTDVDEDIPLAELAEKLLNPGAWRTGNLRKDPNDITFFGEQHMPI
ncbi:unnamed protein product [Phaedon cochleariae]|uniref:Tesmin/TSO1-like CXC domain-containing protein n=1 Tax=Phaedon cochleariae TaxID=80249 RepID=A0A9N9SKC2_PHACE|nr:unnamed protein product [Phaedon cochleariae]